VKSRRTQPGSSLDDEAIAEGPWINPRFHAIVNAYQQARYNLLR
jgi:hypothetical protein